VVAGFLCFGSRRCARLALVAPLLTAGMVALHWASTERLREDDWVSDASIDARVFLPFVAQFLLALPGVISTLTSEPDSGEADGP